MPPLFHRGNFWALVAFEERPLMAISGRWLASVYWRPTALILCSQLSEPLQVAAKSSVSINMRIGKSFAFKGASSS